MTKDPIAFEFFNEIGIIDQLAGALLDSVLPKGMTQAQFGVLNHFVRLDVSEKSPADLADIFQVTRPTMTSTLGRMERNKLIAIRPDPQDGRAKLVSLTDHGRMTRQNCIAALAHLLPVIHQIIPDDDIASLLPRLRAIREKMDANRSPMV